MVAIPDTTHRRHLKHPIVGLVANLWIAWRRGCGHEMSKRLAAVKPTPAKGIHWDAIGVVPTHFGGHERAYAGTDEQLRQRGAVAKRIGQPEHVVVGALLAKRLAQKPLAVQDLPHKRFT